MIKFLWRAIKELKIVLILGLCTVALVSVYQYQINELRESLERSIRNTEDCQEIARQYNNERDSLQKIVNLKTEKP